MSQKMYEKIIEIFSMNTKPDYYTLLIEDVYKKLNTKTKKETIIQLIEDILPAQDYLVKHDNRIFYRRNIYSKIKFRVVLTHDELTNKYMIPGHRILTFSNPNLKLNQLTIVDSENSPLPLQEKQFPQDGLAIYFTLCSLDSISNNLLPVGNFFATTVIDLSEWMKRNDFSQDDKLIFTTLDYDKGLYLIEKESNKKYLKSQFVTKNLNQKFLDSLVSFLTEIRYVSSTASTILAAYSLSNVYLENYPLDTLGMLVTNNEKLELQFAGGFSTLQLKSGHVINKLFQDSLDPSNIPESGVSKSIEGIFDEMGNSYTEHSIYAMILYEMHTNGSVDNEKIFNIVFKEGLNSFYNKKQKENFITAYNKFLKKTLEDFEKKHFDKREYKVIEECVNLKIKIVNFLRKIDENMFLEIENFNPEVLLDLNQCDSALDYFFQMFLKNKISLQDLTVAKSELPVLKKQITSEIRSITKLYDLI